MMSKGRAKASLLIWFLSMGLLLTYLVMQLKIVSDIGQFMPSANQDPQLQALMSEVQNGPAATTLMVRLFDADSSELAGLSSQLRKKLLLKQETFREVRNGEGSLDWRDAKSLFPYRYILSEGAVWDSANLRNSFEQRLSELRAGAGAVLSDMLPQDPQLVFLKYLHGLVDISGPVKQHGVWFDKKQQGALLLVSVRSQSLELDLMQQAVDEIEGAFAALSSTDISSPSVSSITGPQLEIAGPGKMAVDTRSAIQQVMQHMTNFIVLLLIIIFFVAYRSLRSIWLAAIPLLSAITVSLVITQVIFGEVHSIVLVFGITLLGVCLDYPLHLFSHLRTGENPNTSIKRIWPTLRLSGISSVLAFLALLGSGFNGLSQLAVFAASGLVVALVMTRYLLPNWISADRIKPRLWTLNFSFGLKQRLLIGLFLMSIPVFVLIQKDVFWETSIHAISPVPASAREKDRVLRHELNVPEVSHVFLSSSDDIDIVLQESEKIHHKLIQAQALGIINSVWSPSQVLPSILSQSQRQMTLPSAAQLTADLEKALQGLPFRSSAFTSWIKSVSASRDLKPLLYSDIMATPLADIIRQGLFKTNDQWIAVVRIGGIRSEAELNNWLETEPELKKSHIVVKNATEHLLSEYRNTTFERLIAVFMLLVVIVLIWSRSIKQTAWIFLPVSIGILAGVTIPLLLGGAINVFHLLALLLVLGMGLDYSLFFNRKNNDALEKQQNLHAISISALTTSAAFLVLAFSSVPVLAGMGQTVSAGILMCFLSSWLLACPQDENQLEGTSINS